jgi:chromosome segregation ATPase
MLSLVPTSNNAGENFSMFGSATQPKNSGKSQKFQKSGRRLVNSAPSGQYDKKEEERKVKISNNASLDEIDKILEDDALALLNIRKEISGAQFEELEKIRLTVLSIKKEFDQYHVGNNMKEKQVQDLCDQYTALVGVDKSTNQTQTSAKSQMDDLTEQTTIVLEDLAAEQRTIKMQNLMIKRLDDEIGKCRIEIAKANVTLDHAKHDLSLAENNLQVNRQSLLEQESQLEKLQNTLRQRKDQRESKIQMLHHLSVEGEQSVAKLQMSLNENSKVLLSNIFIISLFKKIIFCVF